MSPAYLHQSFYFHLYLNFAYFIPKAFAPLSDIANEHDGPFLHGSLRDTVMSQRHNHMKILGVPLKGNLSPMTNVH